MVARCALPQGIDDLGKLFKGRAGMFRQRLTDPFQGAITVQQGVDHQAVTQALIDPRLSIPICHEE